LRNGSDWMKIADVKLSETQSALLERGLCRRRRDVKMKK
jgi:hypothetical protein